MTVRIRKLIGTFAFIGLIAVWALFAMALAQFAFSATNTLAATLYYVAMGFGWLPLAMLLVRWMQRSDRSS